MPSLPPRLKRLARYLSRPITVLVIPHTDLPLLKGRFSLAFLLFGLGFWSLLTVWAGYLTGRHVDYWATKADNMLMRAKVRYLADQMDRSKQMLDSARLTDRQMRVLLGMRSKDAVLRGGEGIGGPSPSDRAGLARLVSGGALRFSQPAIRQSLEHLRQESERRLASFQEIAWYISNQRSLLSSTPSLWPTSGHIASGYGYRFSPFGRRDDSDDVHSSQFHAGVDIANNPDTPIVAAADGVVRYAGWSSGYGMMALIDHGFGYSTLYGHTSKVTVPVGERVVRGQMIAYMGTTGRSTGHHLHYEVWRHGKPVNPLRYLQVQAGDFRR